MGCSASKLEDEEAVQLCRERKNFIKQAIEQRSQFALGHVAYIESLGRVSLALHSYIDNDELSQSDFMSDSCSTPPFTPIKRISHELGKFSWKNSPLRSIQSEKCVSHASRYLKSGGNGSVSVEERPPRSPETMRINSYCNYYNYSNNQMDQQYGMEGIFGMQPPSPMNQPVFPPPSPLPSSSQWDFFWNPFASLESYGYPGQNSLNRVMNIDEMSGLRQVREEEGIPELEEEDDDESEDDDNKRPVPTGPWNVEQEQHTSENINNISEVNRTEQPRQDQVKKLRSSAPKSVEVSKAMDHHRELELDGAKEMVREEVAEASTPGFTAYVDRRPASMSEVMRDIEHQFTRICESAREVSVMLEANRGFHNSNSSEFTAIKMLNPIMLLRSSSSRSSSSRLLRGHPPYSGDDLCETSSEFSEDSCMVSGSHQSTLDRLYAWEKKLYEEVKSGERIRKAYEKKCTQLMNQDVTKDDPAVMDKMRRIERDLHTQIKVSIHSIESISRRIESLRDEELHPQIMELLQGLGRMWRTMADCHLIQKRVIDEAKLLLANPKLANPPPPASRLGRSASNLESELRNWRSCLQTWFTAQRSYAHALTGWLLCCAPPHEHADRHKSPLSPPRSSGEPPIFRLCIRWSRMVESVSEAQAVEGLEFFAAGVASVVMQQREAEEGRRRAVARGEVVVEEEEVVSMEKMAEVGVRVVCAGMSVAINGLWQLAVKFMEGCEDMAPKTKPTTTSTTPLSS